MEARANEISVAVVPTNQEVADQNNDQMTRDVASIASVAKSFIISTSTEYEQAADLVKNIRTKAKAVTDLFKPIKEAANAAHKKAVEQEKRLLDPLKGAETALKAEMNRYTTEAEKARQRAIEAAQAEARKKADELIQQADQLEQAGESDMAEMMLNEAQVLNETPVAVGNPSPKVKGVSSREDYLVEIIDEAAVPISVSGAVICPVDLAAVKRMVKATKGAIQIPGVKITKVSKTIVRA